MFFPSVFTTLLTRKNKTFRILSNSIEIIKQSIGMDQILSDSFEHQKLNPSANTLIGEHIPLLTKQATMTPLTHCLILKVYIYICGMFFQYEMRKS